MLNLTRQERGVILFLIIISLFGMGVNFILKNQPKRIEYLNRKYEKTDLNQAGLSELCNIPGIGKRIAREIIKYRDDQGEFNNLEELKQIKGIGQAKYEIIKDYFFID